MLVSATLAWAMLPFSRLTAAATPTIARTGLCGGTSDSRTPNPGSGRRAVPLSGITSVPVSTQHTRPG